jgi:hypothetical protein
MASAPVPDPDAALGDDASLDKILVTHIYCVISGQVPTLPCG